jgi:two-component system cell cycle response regulator DivK
MTIRSPATGVGSSIPEQPLVLIVDDNERNRRLARDVLRAAGLETIEAATGDEAIALAELHLPNVILMDLGLPDMDGASAMHRLREGERTAQISVVALTSRPLEGEPWYLEAGFAGYVEKPFDVHGFPDLVRGYCVRSDP